MEKRPERLCNQAFQHYGLTCRCCGAAQSLTIDHIRGDGAKHRREIPPGRYAIYHWLKENNYPEGFQTLCYPCNESKWVGSFCYLHRFVKSNAKSYGQNALLVAIENLGGKKRCVPLDEILNLTLPEIPMGRGKRIKQLLDSLVAQGKLQYNQNPKLYWIE